MDFGSRNTRRVSRGARTGRLRLLGLCGMALLVGCGQPTNSPDGQPNVVKPSLAAVAPTPKIQLAYRGLEVEVQSAPRVASMMSTIELARDVSVEEPLSALDLRSGAEVQLDCRAFTTESEEGPTLHLPALVRLPPVEQSDELELSDTPSQVADGDELVLGHLLPPKPAGPWIASTAVGPVAATPLESFRTVDISALTAPPQVDEPSPASELSPAEQRLLAAVIHDASAVSTGVVTSARLDELAKSKIRRGYALAGRGAYYAARQELIEVLRMISRAKDAQHGAPERTGALAAGLRALDEAADFAPRGTQLEAELNINVTAAAHRTPIVKQLDVMTVLPQQMLDMYFRYAQLKLSLAVAGEPSGSMALHALGKINRQLGNVEPERHPLARRRAIAFQQAALLAHDQNHLAAHELAVLLADSGHFAEAQRLLLQVAAREPNAIVYRNLARVQEKLGGTQQAAANRDYARQLMQRGASGNQQVQWLAPQDFAAIGGRQPRYSTAMATPQLTRSAIPGRRASASTSWR